MRVRSIQNYDINMRAKTKSPKNVSDSAIGAMLDILKVPIIGVMSGAVAGSPVSTLASYVLDKFERSKTDSSEKSD